MACLIFGSLLMSCMAFVFVMGGWKLALAAWLAAPALVLAGLAMHSVRERVRVRLVGGRVGCSLEARV